MRIVACLCWYEEQPSWLSALTASVAKFCDHIVAVDGCYALFPDALTRPTSGPAQAEAIQLSAHAAGIGCTIHTPREPWGGNETEKRSFMFDLALTVAEPWDDWLFVIDADELVTSVPADTHDVLERTTLHAGEIIRWERLTDRPDPHDMLGNVDEDRTVRKLFRAIPGITVGPAHWCYSADINGKPEWLWGFPQLRPIPALHLPLRLEHRRAQRPAARNAAAMEFYAQRDRLGVERIVRWEMATHG